MVVLWYETVNVEREKLVDARKKRKKAHYHKLGFRIWISKYTPSTDNWHRGIWKVFPLEKLTHTLHDKCLRIHQDMETSLTLAPSDWTTLPTLKTLDTDST